MANRKKTEAEKVKPVNITLNGELRAKLAEYTNETGKPVAQLVSKLLYLWFNGEIEDKQVLTPAPAPAPSDELLMKITRLELEVESLKKSRTSQQATLTPGDQGQTSTQTPAIEVSSVTPIEVSPAPVKADSVPGNEDVRLPPVIVRNSRLNKHYTGDSEAFVQSFRAWLKDNGYTQDKFEKTYGFSLSAMGKWEQGKRPLPLDKYDLITAIMKGEVAPSQ